MSQIKLWLIKGAKNKCIEIDYEIENRLEQQIMRFVYKQKQNKLDLKTALS